MAHSTHADLPALTRRGAITLAAAATTATLATPAYAGDRPHDHHALRDTVPLPDGLRPEGITSGPGTTFYVGSVSDGRIVTGDLRTGGTRVLLAAATGRSLRGLYRDPRTGLVWAAGGLGADAHVWAVDGSTGAVVADVLVPGGVFLNDLVVTEHAVWVTDSRVDRLARIALNRRGLPVGTAPTFVALTGEWPAFDGTNIAANGIRALPDGSLVLNNSRAGGLWRVHPRTGDTREIEVRGGPGLVERRRPGAARPHALRRAGQRAGAGRGARAVAAPARLGRHLARRPDRRDARRALDRDVGGRVALGGQRPLRGAVTRHRLVLGLPAGGSVAPAGSSHRELAGRCAGGTP